MRSQIILIAVALSAGGCSTLVKGTSQVVAIQTPDAPGASCELSSPAIPTQTVITPASVNLEKSQHNVRVLCRKECFSDGIGVIATNTEVMTAGNILLGGVVGLAVDASTGAMNNYEPVLNIPMTQNSACKGGAAKRRT